MHEYYSYSYSLILINEYYLYSVKILIPNNIRIRIWSKKQYSLTSDDHEHDSDDEEEQEGDDVKVSVTERSSLVVGLPGDPLPLSSLDINNSQDH